jgi:Mn-dependent DtxR family transcriptional regulator
MRKSISLKTLTRITDFIKKEKESVTITKIKDSLNIDFYSVKLAIKHLLEQKQIKTKEDKYYV